MIKILQSVMSQIDLLLYRVLGVLIRQHVVLSVQNEEEVVKKIRKLQDDGFLVSLDIMVENIESKEDVEQVYKSYVRMILALNNESPANIIIKPTSLGITFLKSHNGSAEKQFFNNAVSLARIIGAKNLLISSRKIELEIDAESTETLELGYQVIAQINKDHPHLSRLLRIALPMHIVNLRETCIQYNLLEFSVRIVKGAGVYDEAPDSLVDEKEVITRYEKYFLECLERKTKPYIATMRDEKLIRKVIESAEKSGYDKHEFVIQMLYGLWPGFGRKLIREGYLVSVYVPIVFPWCSSASDGYIKRRLKMFRSLIWKWISLR